MWMKFLFAWVTYKLRKLSDLKTFKNFAPKIYQIYLFYEEVPFLSLLKAPISKWKLKARTSFL